MTRSSRSALSVLVAVLFAVQTAAAFQYPLSSEAIREAYFLGSGDSERLADFFSKYTRVYPAAAKGPYVATIEFQTPYIVIADQVSQKYGMGYHAPDAVQEFLGKPTPCRVIVQAYFPFNDYENVSVRLMQDGKEIEVQSKHGTFLYTNGEAPFYNGEAPGPVGIEMDVDYDAAKIDPNKEVQVEASPDNGKPVEATFDLSTLK